MGGMAGFSLKGGPEGGGAVLGFHESPGYLVLLTNGQSPGERSRFTPRSHRRRQRGGSSERSQS